MKKKSKKIIKRKKDEDPDLVFDDKTYEMMEPIESFLPPPEVLAKAPRRVNMTIQLDYETIEFFKKEAKKHGGKYQRMIRECLKQYAEAHGGDDKGAA